MRNRDGIVMIEVALSILVLAVGIVAVYVLFTSGLEHVDRAAEETQVALFADGAFNSLEAAALQAARAVPGGGWETFWTDFRAGIANVPLPAGFAWEGGCLLEAAPVQPRTLIFTNRPLHGAATNLVDHALRYRCAVDLFGPDIAQTNRAAVVLQVWPGEFGPTNPVRSFTFYREFRRPDDL